VHLALGIVAAMTRVGLSHHCFATGRFVAAHRACTSEDGRASACSHAGAMLVRPSGL
jgi:hypothetical protein